MKTSAATGLPAARAMLSSVAGLGLLAFAASLSLLAGCFQAKPGDVAGGGGVETTGGAIASLSGSPGGARVRLIPIAFEPLGATAFPDSLETTTRSDGTYSLKGVAPGAYNLDVWQPGDGTRLFRTGITVRAGVSSTLPMDTLRAPCLARLHLEGVRRGTLYQKGTAYARKLDYVEADSITVILDSLPAGTLPPLTLADSAQGAARTRLTDSVKTVAGGLAEPGAYIPWAHKGTWSLDTALAGPGWAEAARDLPVLLRLETAGFDFAEAMAGGEDLRFTDSDGEVLPFELERWDAVAGKAAVWVRLKAPASATRKTDGRIRMFWGRPDAKAMGRSAAVFDTAAGFTAVWHLAEPGNNKPDGFRDATSTGLGGWGTLLSPDPADSGAIAGAQDFDGEGSNIRMDNDPLTWKGALTVSAWIAPDFDNGETANQAILARWEENDSAGFWLEYAPEIRGLRLGLGLASPAKVVRVEAPELAIQRGAWHLVAATFDGTTAIIYWDGIRVATLVPGPAVLAENVRDFLIGAKGDADPNKAEVDCFLGRIDEVRIHRKALPPERIRLEYATGKPGSALLRLERMR